MRNILYYILPILFLLIALPAMGSICQVNTCAACAGAQVVDATLYPNPYIVITQKGYTKHYYANSERLAKVLNNINL